MSNILTAPILPVPRQQLIPAGITGATPAPDATTIGSTATFKSQFDSMVASLAGNAPTSDASSKVDALQTALQKKIADLLAKGFKLKDIVQQLAANLANQFAGAFAGDPAQIRAQLQSAFESALSPPGTGPPLSIAESASALAQRFRQVAEAAARVSGETGQSNRLFAGSNSDAANTAGAAPAPSPTNGPGLTTADSIVNAVSASTSLTVSPGDGKTVAPTASAVGSNGDTPIGRLLARALEVLPGATVASAAGDTAALASTSAVGLTPTPSAGSTTSAIGSNGDTPVGRLLARALEALLGPTVAPVASAAGDTAALASTSAVSLTTRTPSVAATLIAAPSDTGSPAQQTAPAVSGAVTPAVSAFLRSFASVLGATDGTPAPDATKATAAEDGVSSLIATTLASSNAPTVSAFMPVQAPFVIDSSNANAPQSALPAAPPPVDPNSIVDQVVRGAFLRTDGTTSEVRLKLVPEYLGDLSVKLIVSGRSVDAQIVAQTADARDALFAGQAQLVRTLADAGLKLTSFNVDLAGGFTSFQQQQQNSSGQPRSSGGHRMLIGGVDTADDNDAGLLAAPSFGPPLLANANFGSLNYLV